MIERASDDFLLAVVTVLPLFLLAAIVDGARLASIQRRLVRAGQKAGVGPLVGTWVNFVLIGVLEILYISDLNQVREDRGRGWFYLVGLAAVIFLTLGNALFVGWIFPRRLARLERGRRMMIRPSRVRASRPHRNPTTPRE